MSAAAVVALVLAVVALVWALAALVWSLVWGLQIRRSRRRWWQA